MQLRKSYYQIPNLQIAMRNCMILTMLLFTFNATAKVQYALELEGSGIQIGNLLEWHTSLELNSQSFTVERAVDGYDFQEIGSIEAAGISDTKQKYRFLDPSIGQNKAFYRLKLIETEGAISYSRTVILDQTNKNQFMVLNLQNIDTEKVFVNLDSVIDGKMLITFNKLNGKEIHSMDINIKAGISTIALECNLVDANEFSINFKLGDELETIFIQQNEKVKKSKSNVASK